MDGYVNTEVSLKGFGGKFVVFQFYGDFYHGCKMHYRTNQMNPLLNKFMGQLFWNTMEAQQRLRRSGYVVVSIWECVFDDMMENDQGLRDFADKRCICSGVDLVESLR